MERGKREQGFHIGLRQSVIAELCEIDAIGTKARRHGQIHRIGDGEVTEQEPFVLGGAQSIVAAKRAPDFDDAPRMAERAIALAFAWVAVDDVHRHVAAQVHESRMHFASGAARLSAGEQVFRPELLFREKVG